VTTRLYASDEIEHFAWLRSVAFDRDVDFDNEYRYFYDAGIARSPGFHETFLERVNETGHRINYAPVGAAVLWAPFYALGHTAAAVTGAPTDGFSQPNISAVPYATACYAVAAMLLSAVIARRLLGRGFVAAVVIAVGTPLIFYAYVAPGFAHASSAFAVALFVWTWLRGRRDWSVPGALALCRYGVHMSIVREQDVLLSAPARFTGSPHGTRLTDRGVSRLWRGGRRHRRVHVAISPQLSPTRRSTVMSVRPKPRPGR
jgi:hypothetical protein